MNQSRRLSVLCKRKPGFPRATSAPDLKGRLWSRGSVLLAPRTSFCEVQTSMILGDVDECTVGTDIVDRAASDPGARGGLPRLQLVHGRGRRKKAEIIQQFENDNFSFRSISFWLR